VTTAVQAVVSYTDFRVETAARRRAPSVSAVDTGHADDDDMTILMCETNVRN